MIPVPQLKRKLKELEVEEEYMLDNENTILPICTMEAFGLEILPESYQITNKVDYIEDEGGFDEDEYIMKEDIKRVVLNYLSRKDDFSGMCIVLSYGFLDGQRRSVEEIANLLNTTKDQVVTAQKTWIKEAHDDVVKGRSPLIEYSIVSQNLGTKFTGKYNEKPFYDSYGEFVMSYVDCTRAKAYSILEQPNASEIDRKSAFSELSSAEILENIVRSAEYDTTLSNEKIKF